MNREEAQFILGAYRPNSEDAHDPLFQEALALVRQDPVLAQWFTEQQALDRAFSAKIRECPVPADLKAQLLLARTTARRVAWWRSPVWLAAAACFALLFVVAGSLFRGRANAAEFTAFRGAMAAASADMSDHFNVFGLDASGYTQWLTEHRGASDFVLPPALAASGIAACKIVEWRQQRVTMLCIKHGGQHLDVFVINASDLPGASLGTTPQFFADGGATSAAWRREGNVYLLASAMTKSDLQQIL